MLRSIWKALKSELPPSSRVYRVIRVDQAIKFYFWGLGWFFRRNQVLSCLARTHLGEHLDFTGDALLHGKLWVMFSSSFLHGNSAINCFSSKECLVQNPATWYILVLWITVILSSMAWQFSRKQGRCWCVDMSMVDVAGTHSHFLREAFLMILAGVPLEVEIGTWFLSQSWAVGCWNHHRCPKNVQ